MRISRSDLFSLNDFTTHSMAESRSPESTPSKISRSTSSFALRTFLPLTSLDFTRLAFWELMPELFGLEFPDCVLFKLLVGPAGIEFLPRLGGPLGGMFLGGPPLVKMATGEESDDETLGGGQMHAEISGLADYLAEDEMDALRIGREVVSHLNWRKEGKEPIMKSDDPVLDTEDLLGLVDPDLKRPLDVREVIGRITDGSRFEEFKPLFGPTLICGFATIHGYTVGVLGNNGPIFPDTAAKGGQFVQLCNQIDIPIIFLHNITGFVVGKDFERAGQIKRGAQFLNSVSNSTVPHLTIIIGASYGAGTYAMSGRAYDNKFTFLWPTAKVAVMGPQQIAGVMSIVRRARAARTGEKFDEKEDAKMVAFAEKAQEEGSLALRATGAISDDGIIDPRDTRTVLGICLSLVNGRKIEGAPGYGVYRL